MDLSKQRELQNNIMNNSKSLQEYIREFSLWEKDISDKDKILAKTNFEPKESTYLLHRDEQEAPDLKGIPTGKPKEKKKKNKKLKRDETAMKDYYDKWEHFDPV